jgi:hypothetical protein
MPPIGPVIARDVAYNNVHPYLIESNAQTRCEWIAALDTIESLNPRAVIAGHKKLGKDAKREPLCYLLARYRYRP